jgi:hypothetical protein
MACYEEKEGRIIHLIQSTRLEETQVRETQADVQDSDANWGPCPSYSQRSAYLADVI